MVASEVQNNFTTIRDVVNGQIEGSGVNIMRHSVDAKDFTATVDYYLNTQKRMQPGVVGSGHLLVTPVAGRDVAVAAGFTWVLDSANVVSSGTAPLIPAFFNASSLSVPANTSGSPRLDQVVFTLSDYGQGTISVVQGTPTAGATLDNRNGAAALPASSIRLADLLTANGFAGPYVNGTSLRDRRPWARGMYWWQVGTTGNITVAATALPGVNLITGGAVRLENSVSDVVLQGQLVITADASARIAIIGVSVDGAVPQPQVRHNIAASQDQTLGLHIPMSISPGSHTYNVQAAVGGTSVVNRNASQTLNFSIYEVLHGQGGAASNT